MQRPPEQPHSTLPVQPPSIPENTNTSSPIDGWVQGMIQTMNGLSSNPEQRSILRKRSF